MARVGVLIGIDSDGKFELVDSGSDITNLKKQLKDMKTNEAKCKYDRAMVFVDPTKTFKFKKDKPELAKNDKPESKKVEKSTKGK